MGLCLLFLKSGEGSMTPLPPVSDASDYNCNQSLLPKEILKWFKLMHLGMAG